MHTLDKKVNGIVISCFKCIELTPDVSEMDISKYKTLCRTFAFAAKRLLKAFCFKNILVFYCVLLSCVPILKQSNAWFLTFITFTLFFFYCFHKFINLVADNVNCFTHMYINLTGKYLCGLITNNI